MRGAALLEAVRRELRLSRIWLGPLARPLGVLAAFLLALEFVE